LCCPAITIENLNNELKAQADTINYEELGEFNTVFQNLVEIITEVHKQKYILDVPLELLVTTEQLINEIEQKVGRRQFPDPNSGMGQLVRLEKFGRTAQSLCHDNDCLRSLRVKENLALIRNATLITALICTVPALLYKAFKNKKSTSQNPKSQAA
jgi:hypothetical protein